MKNKYSFGESISNFFSLIYTKLFFNSARLIRRPIYIRGKKSFCCGKGLTTGRFCRFDLNGIKKTLFFGSNCQIGDFVHIVAHSKVAIGDNTLIASKVFISDSEHGIYHGNVCSSPIETPKDRTLNCKDVIIGQNVWIGENCVILAGSIIGSGSIIGANSVVKGIVPDNSIAVGSIARVVKKWDANLKQWIKLENNDQ